MPLLAERHRVIRYDQRGFGRSPRPGSYSLVEDLVAVLDAAGLERAALAGASRGGNIALATAVERPERVSALILLGSGLSGAQLDVGWTPNRSRAGSGPRPTTTGRPWPSSTWRRGRRWAPTRATGDVSRECCLVEQRGPGHRRARRRAGERHNRPTLVITGAGTSAGSTRSATGSPGRFPCSLGRNPGGRSHDSLAGA